MGRGQGWNTQILQSLKIALVFELLLLHSLITRRLKLSLEERILPLPETCPDVSRCVALAQLHFLQKLLEQNDANKCTT